MSGINFSGIFLFLSIFCCIFALQKRIETMLLNLQKEDERIHTFLSSRYISYDYFIFNGGEPHIKFKSIVTIIGDVHNFIDSNVAGEVRDSKVEIYSPIRNSEDLIKLLLAVDVLRRMKVSELILFIPYFPAARQDRVTSINEPFSLQVIAGVINSLKADTVYVLDPHSDVVAATINNCIPLSNYKFISKVISSCKKVYNLGKPIVLVSPDAGASKKIMSLAQSLTAGGHKVEVIKADKLRDVATGEILSFEVYSTDLTGKHCIVVDDICDGGGTFIGLAKELRRLGAATLVLAVTHGIFSKGVNILLEYYDGIFTTNSFYKEESEVNNLHVIKL